MSDQLAAGTPALQLRADPNALAPERLLVFELTGGIYKFEEAVRLVSGLEFLGVEDLDPDEDDKNPVLYLMVPSEGALSNLVTLWRDWRRNGSVPNRFSSWKALLSQLRDIRPWGPQDRIAIEDAAVLTTEADHGHATIRVEIELVFRQNGAAAEATAHQDIQARGGVVISRARIAGAAYHAILADIPTLAIREALAGNPESLAGSDAILQIRPQSVFHAVPYEEAPGDADGEAPNIPSGDPIAGIFDAVPLSQHPRLANTLSLDDPFGLEPLAVGPRRHGTAMASAVVHGDLNNPWVRPRERPVYFVGMMYDAADGTNIERFPDRLPADLFEQALVHMRDGPSPAAPHVLIVNASLGDANKPFSGRMSGWSRVVDYLASRYGVLFVISAGNHMGVYETENMSAMQFEDLPGDEKMRVTLRASASQIALRRILAPAEAMNAITVGALHADHYQHPHPLPASTFDVWAESGLCTVSSGLGPGYAGATKPDILAPGGRLHVRLMPHGAHHRLQPLTVNAGAFGGIGVAAPPTETSFGPNVVARSVGTSIAAALATGVAARAHEALEAAYPDFVTLPSAQRAVLLKALLVHGARWTQARDLLIEILGPSDNRQHYRQKDDVRRYIGFGAYDPDRVIDCTADRATLWAVGQLGADQGKRFRIPWPAAMSGQARPHSVNATLAWFSPRKPGAVAYRGARMKIIEPSKLGAAGIKAAGVQPDPKQAHKGTVVHRRWDGAKASAIAGDGFFEIDIQREADSLPDDVQFALVVTPEMAGELAVYNQVLNRVALKPTIGVPA
ncbi:S8 family peptidase [Rhizobium panacihumi]|uniref:S8 family peptidase n=1 Tax=Rhizobium panacihumi TaxID=2008450 RepID=UPI003D79D9C1